MVYHTWFCHILPLTTTGQPSVCWAQQLQMHSCQPLLGVNRSPQFVNLYFPYAGWGLLILHWYQQHFEFQSACAAVEGRSNVVLNMHAQLQISLLMRFLSLSAQFFNLFASLKQQQNLMKIMFSCIHFPVWPYPCRIMKNLHFMLVNCMGWQVCRSTKPNYMTLHPLGTDEKFSHPAFQTKQRNWQTSRIQSVITQPQSTFHHSFTAPPVTGQMGIYIF